MLQALNGGGPRPQSGLPPAPLGFRAVEGLQAAWRGTSGAIEAAEAASPTVAQANGLRYEKRIKEIVREDEKLKLLGVEDGPWFTFRDRWGLRKCQPDLLFPTIGEHALVVEIKLQHTTDAWWQLRRLYEPVVEKVYGRPVKLLVITANFDPAVPWPEALEFMDDPDALSRWFTGSTMGVLRWRA